VKRLYETKETQKSREVGTYETIWGVSREHPKKIFRRITEDEGEDTAMLIGPRNVWVGGGGGGGVGREESHRRSFEGKITPFKLEAGKFLEEKRFQNAR